MYSVFFVTKVMITHVQYCMYVSYGYVQTSIPGLHSFTSYAIRSMEDKKALLQYKAQDDIESECYHFDYLK